MNIYDGIPGFVVFLIVLGFFAVVAIIAFIIYRTLNPKLKKDEQNQEDLEKQHAQEELDRILQPVEDEKIAKEIENYKEDE